jgi:hypothetical protein
VADATPRPSSSACAVGVGQRAANSCNGRGEGRYHDYDEDEAVHGRVDESIGRNHEERLAPSIAADVAAKELHCLIPVVREESVDGAKQHPPEQPIRRDFLTGDETRNELTK